MTEGEGQRGPGSDADWTDYNAAQDGRPVRPLLLHALEAWRDAGSQPDAPVAVELGCGAGRETAHLIAQGFAVHAYDADPSVAERMRALAGRGGATFTLTRFEDIAALPSCDLLFASASLPFVPRAHFDRVRESVRAALRPGAVLAVDLFGDRDEWAGGEGTFLSAAEVDGLLKGLDVVLCEEQEFDGRSFAGPKHWHLFSIVARRPV